MDLNSDIEHFNDGDSGRSAAPQDFHNFMEDWKHSTIPGANAVAFHHWPQYDGASPMLHGSRIYDSAAGDALSMGYHSRPSSSAPLSHHMVAPTQSNMIDTSGFALNASNPFASIDGLHSQHRFSDQTVNTSIAGFSPLQITQNGVNLHDINATSGLGHADPLLSSSRPSFGHAAPIRPLQYESRNK